jgi:hypothetical protein
MAVSLPLVGLVSGTFIRHVVQIVPILVALPAVLTRRRWAAYAAIPLFAAPKRDGLRQKGRRS